MLLERLERCHLSYLSYSEFRTEHRLGRACFLDRNFLTVADLSKIQDRLDDGDLQVYIDKKFLRDIDAVAAYVDSGISSEKARANGNPFFYRNDLVLSADPNAGSIDGQDLIHEMFHAIFDLHDAELAAAFVPDDEALTSYFEFVLNIGWRSLMNVEKELKKARAGRRCSKAVVQSNLEKFASDLQGFLLRPAGGGRRFGAILPIALELMRTLTGFHVPIEEIVERYLSGECGMCE